MAVTIDEVLKDSVAHDCGFRCGDVVTAVANVEVNHSLELFNLLHKNREAGLAHIKVLRDNEEITLTLSV